MKKKNVFDRAAEAAEKGSSETCRALVAELETLIKSEARELDAVRPPGRAIHDGAGRVVRILPAGERFERASTADDRGAVAECLAAFDRLTARRDRAERLRHALKARQKKAAEAEALAAAPAKAKAAIKALDDLLDRHAAAVAEFNSVHAELKDKFAELVSARGLDPTAPTVSLDQFYRVGVALAYTAPKRKEIWETNNFAAPPHLTRPLFGNPTTALSNARVLVDVPRSVRKRTREILGTRTGLMSDAHVDLDTSDKAVDERLRDWYRELVKLLANDDVKAASKLGAPQMKRGAAVFPEEAA